MKLTVGLLVSSAIGVIAGAFLIATWAIGLAIIADSVAVAAYALLRDLPDTKTTAVPVVHFAEQVLERSRSAR